MTDKTNVMESPAPVRTHFSSPTCNVYDIAEPILSRYASDQDIFLKTNMELQVLSARPDFPLCRPDIEAVTKDLLNTTMRQFCEHADAIAGDALDWTRPESVVKRIQDGTISLHVVESFERELHAFIAANRLLIVNLAFGMLIEPNRLLGLAVDTTSENETVIRFIASQNQTLDLRLNRDELATLCHTLTEIANQGN